MEGKIRVKESARNRYVSLIKTKTRNNRSKAKALRLKCLECSNYQPSEVKECTCPDCALYPFRMGRNPFRAKKGTKNDV